MGTISVVAVFFLLFSVIPSASKLFKLSYLWIGVGDVASSNLVVPTICLVYFQLVSRETLGPFCPN